MNDATFHPGGIISRPLPDRLPAIDDHQGFAPPFALDIWDGGSSETVATGLPHLRAAARLASRWESTTYHRERDIEITDSRGRIV